MEISEAIDILAKAGYITESVEFSGLDHVRIGQHYDKNRPSKQVRNDKSMFKDPGTYNDREGLKWTYVKKRDDLTLKSAILDGMIDTGRVQGNYNDISTEEQIDRLFCDSGIERKVNTILDYLHKYMKGTVTVYRGFKLPTKNFSSMNLNDPFEKKKLIRELSNTNKEFNSFTTDLDTAVEFMEYNGIIITGIAEPNDIMFAFTAYLLGRHGGIGERELNISNMKALRDLRIMDNADILRKKNYKRLFKMKDGIEFYADTPLPKDGRTNGLVPYMGRIVSASVISETIRGKEIVAISCNDYWRLYCDGRRIRCQDPPRLTPYFMSDKCIKSGFTLYELSDDMTELRNTGYDLVSIYPGDKWRVETSYGIRAWVNSRLEPVDPPKGFQ